MEGQVLEILRTADARRPQTTQKNALSPQLLAQIGGFGAVRARGRGS